MIIDLYKKYLINEKYNLESVKKVFEYGEEKYEDKFIKFFFNKLENDGLIKKNVNLYACYIDKENINNMLNFCKKYADNKSICLKNVDIEALSDVEKAKYFEEFLLEHGGLLGKMLNTKMGFFLKIDFFNLTIEEKDYIFITLLYHPKEGSKLSYNILFFAKFIESCCLYNFTIK